MTFADGQARDARGAVARAAVVRRAEPVDADDRRTPARDVADHRAADGAETDDDDVRKVPDHARIVRLTPGVDRRRGRFTRTVNAPVRGWRPSFRLSSTCALRCSIWAWAIGYDQRQDHAEDGQSCEDVEDRVQCEAPADEEAAQQRSAHSTQPAESGAPGDAGGAHVGPVVVRDEAVDQGLRSAGAQTDDCDGRQADGERKIEGQQPDRRRADREAGGDNDLRAEPICDSEPSSAPITAPPLSTSRNDSEPLALKPARSISSGSQVLSE